MLKVISRAGIVGFLTTLISISSLEALAEGNDVHVSNSSNESRISKIECQGTGEEPGAERDFFTLITGSNGKYSVKIALKSKAVKASLISLGDNFECEFSPEDKKIFFCSLEEGYIQATRIDSFSIPTPGFPVHKGSSLRIDIAGSEFADKLDEAVAILKFRSASNCTVE